MVEPRGHYRECSADISARETRVPINVSLLVDWSIIPRDHSYVELLAERLTRLQEALDTRNKDSAEAAVTANRPPERGGELAIAVF